MPTLRIAHLSNFSPKKLGTGETRLVALASAARERGHRFTIFGGTPIHQEVATGLEAAGATWKPLADLKRNSFKSAIRLSRDFDVLQLNMIPPRGRIAIAAYLAWPTKILFVDRVSGPPGEPDSRRAAPYRVLDHLTMLRVHQLAGITEYVRARAVARFGLTQERTCTIYNGVDTERFAPGPPPPVGSPVRILTVASLIPEKGIDVLLHAVAKLEPGSWHLTVVGEGSEERNLRALSEALGIRREVSFLGLRDDVPDLMRAADVFVHPAVWQEALGNTVLEGMASGCCVLASRVGGIPELIEDGEDGLLVEAGNWMGMAESLSKVGRDPSLRRRLGLAARKRVVRDFSLQASIKRHLDWYEVAARGEFLS